MVYYIYILKSEKDGSYYIGHTKDLRKRLERHNEGRSLYTKRKLPWRLIYHEELPSRSEALRREIELKRKKSRSFIEQLVSASRL